MLLQSLEVNRLIYDLSNASRVIKSEAEAAVEYVLENIEETAKDEFVPRDTEELHDSISSEVWTEAGMIIGEAGPSAEHGRHVEDGTVDTAPQAFMGPALDRHSHELDDLLASAGERSINVRLFGGLSELTIRA